MLIPSERHTEADLELWRELEETDMMHGERLMKSGKVERSVAAIREFAAAGPCYCGVSWGKDSVVAAELCRRVDPNIPFIHLRPTNHNPDCDSVVAAFGAECTDIHVDYSDLHGRNLHAHELDRETDRRWYAAIRELGRYYGVRHILGIRSSESSGRRMRERVWGESSPNGCAPITRWTTEDVFGYLAVMQLPVHPAYAMLGGGRWPRERLRVAEIGDTHGTGGGRREWEQEYYGDVLRRLESK